MRTKQFAEHDKTIVKRFQFNLAVGSDFFTEIAKLRALRKLWALVLDQYGMNEELYLHCETTQLNKSSLDSYNNMLRTTTESMSAILGGCNSLVVRPFDITFKNTSEFSARMARNQQLILKEEAYLDKVADAGAGSYYIESLTDKIAEEAWQDFKRIQSKGGYLACLKSEYIQAAIEMQANVLQEELKEGQRVLIGVNKYPNASEKVKPDFTEEDQQVEKTEIKRVKSLRLAAEFELKKELNS
jgi:methylmalonyl-CoA mutase